MTSFIEGTGDLQANITEDWLKAVGFKWHQLERQPSKHWLLWCGDAVRAHDHSLTSYEDIGIEVASLRSGSDSEDAWFVWFRSDAAGRYHRFIHVRYMKRRIELVGLVEAVTGFPWEPNHHFYGSVKSPQEAQRCLSERERMDRRLREDGYPWSEIEEDPTRGRALPEHLEAHAKSGVEKKP